MSNDQKASYTQGPWTFSKAISPTDGEYDFGIFANFDGKKYCIAEAFGRVATDIRPDSESNARLIAAAPELLEALKCACAQLDAELDDKVWHEMFGAEPDPKKASRINRYDVAEMCRAAIAKAEGRAP